MYLDIKNQKGFTKKKNHTIRKETWPLAIERSLRSHGSENLKF